MTKTESIRETVKSLPELPIVYAASMLIAQGWEPSQSEQAAITARQDFFRSLELPATVSIPVRDTYTNTLIGHLTFVA